VYFQPQSFSPAPVIGQLHPQLLHQLLPQQGLPQQFLPQQPSHFMQIPQHQQAPLHLQQLQHPFPMPPSNQLVPQFQSLQLQGINFATPTTYVPLLSRASNRQPSKTNNSSSNGGKSIPKSTLGLETMLKLEVQKGLEWESPVPVGGNPVQPGEWKHC
jgi:hypothetical protein